MPTRELQYAKNNPDTKPSEAAMRRALQLLLAVSICLATTSLHAVDLITCNKGKIQVSYATAEQQGGLLQGPLWSVAGWHNLKPGDCENVYQHDSEFNGPIYVLFTFTDSAGKFGSVRFKMTDSPTSVLRRSSKPLCVTLDTFKYTRTTPDPTGPCDPGYFPMPVSLYLEPPTINTCTDRLGACGTYNFDLRLDETDHAIPSQHPIPTTTPTPK
jgi:Protein of unknown function (DUF1036)